MNKSKHFHILSTLLAVLIGAPVVAFLIFALTFDPNAYRPKIADALSEKIGRQVKLGGPIHLGFSFDQGVKLSVRDVSVANPSWASRPVMAHVGALDLGVAWRPLLRYTVDVASLKINDADVLIETNASGQSNWELNRAVNSRPQENDCAGKDCLPQPNQPGKVTKPLVFHVNGFSLKNSKLTMRDKKGEMSSVSVSELQFVPQGKGMKLTMAGDYNGVPLSADLTSEAPLENILKVKWPFETNIAYSSLRVNMKGVLDSEGKQFIGSYAVGAGDSLLKGQMHMAYGGVRPDISGILVSEKLYPLDFKIDTGTGEKSADKGSTVGSSSPDQQDSSKFVFSRDPINLDGLKAVDANLDVKIGELSLGPSSLKDVQTKLDLKDGRLLLSPFKAMVGDRAIEGQIKLDAEKKPVQLSAILKAYQIDLSKLVSLGGVSSFIESKGDVDMDITSSGNSPHELASNADGQINMVMAGGSVSGQAAGNIAGDLLNVFAPGAGGITKPQLNCMVAHLKITNGQVDTQGMLIDTAQATLMGTGGANLRDETINMVLHTRSKLVDVSALTPPLHVTGPLTSPSYKPDAAATVEKVQNILKTGSLSGTNDVPEIIQAEGQNACEYTLKHPKPSSEALPPPSIKDTLDKATGKLKDVGSKIMGIFGK